MHNVQPNSRMALLRILHLADSALAIGSLAHSFGLETMVEEHGLAPSGLEEYLRHLLEEQLLVDAVFCRGAYACGAEQEKHSKLNKRLNALRIARESREASIALGHRFSLLAEDLADIKAPDGPMHFSIAFGSVGAALEIEVDDCVAGFVHQSVLGIISAAQRLMPLGQRDANRLAWDLKSAILDTVDRSRMDPDQAFCFAHLPELASMRHPNLFTRLFIS